MRFVFFDFALFVSAFVTVIFVSCYVTAAMSFLCRMMVSLLRLNVGLSATSMTFVFQIVQQLLNK